MADDMESPEWIIYYIVTQRGRIWLLLAYPKNEKDDLSESEKAVLKAITPQLGLKAISPFSSSGGRYEKRAI